MHGPEEQVEAGLLFLVLELEPEHLSLPELTRRMSAKAPRRRAREAGAVAGAAASLIEVGLLSQSDGRIAPTPAAIRFNALYI